MRDPLRFLLLTFAALPAVSASPFLVAHRGASADAPENTLPAFELAWERGADAIEGDFHLTRDGHVVCIHDFDTKKTAGRKLVVRDSTLAELRALDVGKWKGPTWAGTRIPTLAEVLATVPKDRTIYIEIKCGPEILPPLLEDVRRSGLRDEQIVFISFEAEVIRTLKKEAPQFTANWLVSFKDQPGRRPSDVWTRTLATLRDLRADGLGTNDHPELTRERLAELTAAGFQFHAWTIDAPAAARRLLALGTRSITTNTPGKLREALARP